MMRSLFSGVSGLKSHQTRMDVIGNNIANINTIGFKSSRATFSDILSQTQKGASSPSTNLGGTNPTQIGLGAAVASIDLVTNDGSPQSTGKNTDVALSGNGMFVLKKGSSYYYSRDGAFEFDNDGNYVLPGSGLYVQGWNAVEGALNTNEDPSNIVVPAGRAMPATATSTVDFNGNLNASALTIKSITYTRGGSGADTSLVSSSSSIEAITYSLEFSGTSTDTATAVNFGAITTYAVPVTSGTGAAATTTTTDIACASTSTVTGTLHLTNTNTGETTTVYKDSGSYTAGAAYTDENLTDTGWTITSIDYVVAMNGVEAGADDAVAVGTNSTTYNGYIIGTAAQEVTTKSIELSLTDMSDASIKKTRTVSTAGTTYGIYSGTTDEDVVRTFGTEEGSADSVNVDGTNIIAATLTLSDGSTQKVTSGFYEVGHSIPVTTTVTIYDSEGKTHAVTMLIDKDPESTDPNANTDAKALGNNNRWRIYLAPATGTKGPATYYSKDESDGSHTDGYFNQSDTSPNGAVSYIYFNDDGSFNASATSGGAMTLEYSNGNGASSTTSSVNFTGLTQFSGNSTSYPTADGNSFGVLQSISIDSSGVLTGTYTNGVLRFEAQIAVAQFVNMSGLTKTGTSLYQESNNSGKANIKTVTDLGLTVTPSSLEMSNVDLASELSDMIVTQRGFQANSKIITVGDEMLETLVNMKR